MQYSQSYGLSINKKNGTGLYTSNVVNMDSAGAIMGEQAEMKLITHEASEETSSQSPLGISICLSTHYIRTPFAITFQLPAAAMIAVFVCFRCAFFHCCLYPAFCCSSLTCASAVETTSKWAFCPPALCKAVRYFCSSLLAVATIIFLCLAWHVSSMCSSLLHSCPPSGVCSDLWVLPRVHAASSAT